MLDNGITLHVCVFYNHGGVRVHVDVYILRIRLSGTFWLVADVDIGLQCAAAVTARSNYNF